MVKAIKETLQISCIHNTSKGSGATLAATTLTTNTVPVVLFAVKDDNGGFSYYYRPACRNYKINETTKTRQCAKAMDEEKACKLEETLNLVLKEAEVLYDPALKDQTTKL